MCTLSDAYGSVNTLMNKIFKDKKEPLFGRQTGTMHVRPFRPSVLKEIMSEYCPEYKKSDLLALYTLTGGVAKYVELFIDHKKFTEKTMLNMFFERDSYFLSEGKNMLVDEFGKDYGIYFSILTLILHIPADTRSAFPVISVQSPVSIQCCWQS